MIKYRRTQQYLISEKGLIELYKFYCGTAENISNKRMQSNSYFFGLHALLSSMLPIILKYSEYKFLLNLIIVILIGNCYVWYKSILYYKELNSAKFRVINEIEEQKINLLLYKKEWSILESGKHKNKRLSKYESYIPLGFIIIYLVVLFILDIKEFL